MDRFTRNRKKIKNQKHTEKSLRSERIRTQMYREELEHGLQLTDRVQKRRSQMAKEIEWEVQEQKRLQDRIQNLKNEYANLKFECERYEVAQAQNRAQKKILKQRVKNWERSIANVENKMVIKNDYPKLLTTLSNRDDQHPKENSVLLSVLAELIKATSENEFEDMNWQVRMAHNSKQVSAAITFTNLSLQYQDMKEIYGQVISKVKMRFDTRMMKIQTKTKKDAGIVSAVEITVSLGIDQRTRAELP